jgi:sialic acid synthase SpsE
MCTLRNAFDCLVGYSDHSLTDVTAIAACALGACVIEKHFTLDRTMEGPDHQSSYEPRELKEWAKKIRECEIVLGSSEKMITDEETDIRKINRKSFVAVRNINQGESFSWDNVILKRPGTGILPFQQNYLFGKKADKKIAKDSLISFSDIAE